MNDKWKITSQWSEFLEIHVEKNLNKNSRRIFFLLNSKLDLSLVVHSVSTKYVERKQCGIKILKKYSK